MTKAIVALSLVLTSVFVGLSVDKAEARHSLSACGHVSSFRDIPCSEVDRAITEASREFGISESRYRSTILCESGFNPFNGSFYLGLTQQHPRYWPGRVINFNRAVEPNVLGNPLSPFDNARVGAWMIRSGGWSDWPVCG